MPTLTERIELAEKPACSCERCLTLHTMLRRGLVGLLEQQIHSEAVDTLTTRDHYRDAALLAAAQQVNERQPIAPRLPVGPFCPQLAARPILLEVDDPVLAQLRDLVASLGNWYDFAAFNELAFAQQLNEAAARKAKLDAWNEGYQAGFDAAYTQSGVMNNPYAAIEPKEPR